MNDKSEIANKAEIVPYSSKEMLFLMLKYLPWPLAVIQIIVYIFYPFELTIVWDWRSPYETYAYVPSPWIVWLTVTMVLSFGTWFWFNLGKITRLEALIQMIPLLLAALLVFGIYLRRVPYYQNEPAPFNKLELFDR